MIFWEDFGEVQYIEEKACFLEDDSFKDKDILIFNSPLYSVSMDDGEDHIPPLGLGYSITGLKNAGVSAVLVDSVYEKLSNFTN